VLPRDENGRRAGTGTGAAGEAADEAGFRSYGKSKDSRPDLPQVIVGMAVTRDGIPVRCWCWPGDTAFRFLICRTGRIPAGQVTAYRDRRNGRARESTMLRTVALIGQR